MPADLSRLLIFAMFYGDLINPYTVCNTMDIGSGQGKIVLCLAMIASIRQKIITAMKFNSQSNTTPHSCANHAVLINDPILQKVKQTERARLSQTQSLSGTTPIRNPSSSCRNLVHCQLEHCIPSSNDTTKDRVCRTLKGLLDQLNHAGI